MLLLVYLQLPAKNHLISSEEPREIWNVNIFGKTLEQLVDDGISGKVTKINDDSQEKLQNAMEKIVNESSGGLICIII